MNTFGSMFLKLQERDHLLGSGEEPLGVQAIKNGINLNKKHSDFWNDFISVCANADAMADLLGVSKEQVLSWPNKIKELVSKTQAQNDTEKSKIMTTGL